MTYVHIENARLPEQEKVMRQIMEDGVCPFCPENLERYHPCEILEEGEHWLMTRNQWPYAGTRNHFLAIAKAHIDTLGGITPDASAELITLFQKLAEEHDVAGGTIAFRFVIDAETPEGYSSTVQHLHAHMIEPDVSDPEHQGVKFSVSKGAKR